MIPIIGRERESSVKNRWNVIFGCLLLMIGVALGQETYIIKPGDNLTKIARKHGCTVAELIQENGLKSNAVIHPGQKLKIPGATETTPITPADAPDIYTIRPGDTFSSIARRHDMSVEDLMAANPDTDAKTLRPGQKIKLGIPQDAATGSTGGTANDRPAEAEETTPPADKPAIVTMTVDAEMTYGEFAAKHGTDIARLNELNGLDLDASTLLAKGSELYVPQMPAPAEAD